jgi:hypothetical protein
MVKSLSKILGLTQSYEYFLIAPNSLYARSVRRFYTSLETAKLASLESTCL